jgi:DNA-binding MarR family transcriptional regulator
MEYQEVLLQLLDSTNELKRRLKQPYRSIGMTNHQYHVLKKLYQEERFHPSELAAVLGMDRPSMTVMLHTMKSKGWICLEPDAKNRKFKVAFLTQEGGRVYRLAKFRLLELSQKDGSRPTLPSGQLEAFSQVVRHIDETDDLPGF